MNIETIKNKPSKLPSPKNKIVELVKIKNINIEKFSEINEFSGKEDQSPSKSLNNIIKNSKEIGEKTKKK